MNSPVVLARWLLAICSFHYVDIGVLKIHRVTRSFTWTTPSETHMFWDGKFGCVLCLARSSVAPLVDTALDSHNASYVGLR